MQDRIQVASRGFTLIELLVVLGIIGALAAALSGVVIESQLAANQEVDRVQLRTHAAWLKLYERKHREALPREDGHRFVLSTWTSKIFHHDEEELDRYFSPGLRANDVAYRAARDQMEVGVDPWPTLAAVSSADTHYAGRAKSHIKTARRPGEVLLATDNEGGWSWQDGTVHVLLSKGIVRSYSYQDLQKRFGLGAFDELAPVSTHGASSPIPECRKLAN